VFLQVPRRTVLVVDDDDELRENIGECLALERHACWLASSPQAALERVRHEGRAPDLVLLDHRTEGLSAQEFLARLKEHGPFARTPVVVMTAAWDREIPRDLVPDGVLVKPFDLVRLLRAVREALGPPPAQADARAV